MTVKKLNSVILLSLILTLFSCGFDEPDPDDNDADDPEAPVFLTQDITLTADEYNASVQLPAGYTSWTIADDSAQYDWLEIDSKDAELAENVIPIKAQTNLTGEIRFATMTFLVENAKGNSGTFDVNITQEPTAHDGRNLHLTLPSKFVAGRNIYVYSSTTDFDKEQMQIILGDYSADCKVVNMHNVMAEIPDIKPGQYPLNVKIGESTYAIGQTEVYEMSENDYLPVQYIPDTYNPLLLNIAGIINLGAQNPRSTALLADGTASPVIFSDSEGRYFTMPMDRVTRLNSRYIAFCHLNSESEVIYDNVAYNAVVINPKYTTTIIDRIDGKCLSMPYVDPETIKWIGTSKSGNAMFIAGRGDIIAFEISDRIENSKSLGSFNTDYPYPTGCGRMLSLGNGSLLINGQVTPVAPYSTKFIMYNFESGDAHTQLAEIPVYGLGALFRVVNYSRLNSSGTVHMHEIMVEAMDGSSIIYADAWDNDRSAGRHYQAFSLEDYTYLRPVDETGNCTALSINENGAREAKVEREMQNDSELVMLPQPYYGNYRYVKSNGKIGYAALDDYTCAATLLDVADNAYCALGPGNALFAEHTADGLHVSLFNQHSGKTVIYDLPDYGYLGWMISF